MIHLDPTDTGAPAGSTHDGAWLEVAAHRLYRMSSAERDRIERATLTAYRRRASLLGPGGPEVHRFGRAGTSIQRRRVTAGSAIVAALVLAIMAVAQVSDPSRISYRTAVDRSSDRSARPSVVERHRVQDRDPVRLHATTLTPHPSDGRPAGRAAAR